MRTAKEILSDPILLVVFIAGLSLVSWRCLTVRSTTGETPFLSANDRSRWQGMAALVHEQTAIVDRPQAHRDPLTNRATMQSIDRVMHFGPHGTFHSYSSKPPLLVGLYSLPYAIVHLLTGESVYTHPLLVGRWTIALAHLLPLTVYWGLLIGLVRRETQSREALIILGLAVILGTPVNAFAVTVNNHLPGAFAVLLTLVALRKLINDGSADKAEATTNLQPTGNFERSSIGYALAGLAAGFAVVCELPALAWGAWIGIWFLWKAPIRGTLIYGAALGVVGIVSLLSNYEAHGSWRPPYAHRKAGDRLMSLTASADPKLALPLPALIVTSGTSVSLPVGPERSAVRELADRYLPANAILTIWPSLRSSYWELRATDARTKGIIGRIALIPILGGGWEARQWDDWYDYPGTYWTASKLAGVDRGEPSRWKYAFHSLVGHHGVLSLTPIWIFSLTGLWVWSCRASWAERQLAWGIASVTLICMFFYWTRPLVDRNYGGVSCCFRWLLWFTPLWIWLAIPGIEQALRSLVGRFLVWVALAISVATVIVSQANPWNHPWIYQMLQK
jgi:hypothetical protein